MPGLGVELAREGRGGVHHDRPLEGTDNIRVEMHGKDRSIDARRPFATGWRVAGPTPGQFGPWRGVISASPRRSPRAAAGVRHPRTRPGAVGSDAGTVCKENTDVFVNQSPRWNSSAKIAAASKPFLYDFTGTRGSEPVPYSAFLHECCRYPSSGLYRFLAIAYPPLSITQRWTNPMGEDQRTRLPLGIPFPILQSLNLLL